MTVTVLPSELVVSFEMCHSPGKHPRSCQWRNNLVLNCSWLCCTLDGMWPQLGRSDYYALDKDKEFCVGNAGSGFHRAYLLCLLQAQALFPAGLKGIYHGQSKAYYDTMLALAEFGESAREALEQFGPNKTAVWYKDVLKTFDKKRRKNVLEKKQLDSQRLEDAEDEESILKTLQTDFSKASAASAKKM